MKTEKARVHSGCGGVIIKGKCEKCGEKLPSIIKRILGTGPLIEKKDKFNPKEYRQRINRGDDI